MGRSIRSHTSLVRRMFVSRESDTETEIDVIDDDLEWK